MKRLAHLLDQHFLVLLIACYAVAAVLPAPGLWMRHSGFAVTFASTSIRVQMPLAMLALMLFNAGLLIRVGDMSRLARNPLPLLIGLVANLTIPVLYVVGMTGLMRLCHPPELDEVQDLLAGLAIVAAVPIAGSSTGWSQNSDGDVPLSAALVLASTLLSIVTGPLALRLLRPLAVGDYASGLSTLVDGGSGLLISGVVLPIAFGMMVRRLAGDFQTLRWRLSLKFANSVILLLLNYANAAASLPRLLQQPDWHFLQAALFFVIGLCVVLFTSGWVIGMLLHLGRSQRVSLMYGLGMTNNGTGLVLASTGLSGFPQVLLPILLYNLVQHLVAGVAQRWVTTRQDVARFVTRDAAIPATSARV